MAAHATTTYRVADARALADRLMSRGRSKFGGNENNTKADLRAAARMLWHLL